MRLILTNMMNKSKSLKELCDDISISYATGKNWIKLGKVLPSFYVANTPYFFTKDIAQLKKVLNNNNSELLKSRRNKRYISSKGTLYKSYLPKTSSNLKVVEDIITYLKNNNISPSEELIRLILADCAIKLLSLKDNITFSSGIESYIKDSSNLSEYKKLINDILPNKRSYHLINKYKEIFKKQYIYEPECDVLGLIYISCSNINKRKADGIYYTPDSTVNKLLSTLHIKSDKKVFDPCCGSGNFLLHLPECIPPSNIYGNDINSINVCITRINLAIKYKLENLDVLFKNITCKDCLKEKFNQKYDLIIGNPPWGSTFTLSEKNELSRMYQTALASNFEIFDMVVEKSLSLIDNNGILSFVLPESILSVKSHEQIRDILKNKYHIDYIEYLGNIFDKVLCPAIILSVKRKNKQLQSYKTKINNGTHTYEIKIKRDNDTEFYSTDEEYLILKKLEQDKNNIYLKDNADFALGIVTGNNKKLLQNTKNTDNEQIISGKDISYYTYTPPQKYIEFNKKNFQQCAPEKFYRSEEKLIYKFICSAPVFAYDNSKSLTLNSCNILIPKIKTLNIKYIMAILNSRIIKFYNKKKFNSIKLLRSNIERFPIAQATIKEQKDIIKSVEQLTSNPTIKDYNTLDKKIAKIYNISDHEYSILLNSLSQETLYLR